MEVLELLRGLPPLLSPDLPSPPPSPPPTPASPVKRKHEDIESGKVSGRDVGEGKTVGLGLEGTEALSSEKEKVKEEQPVKRARPAPPPPPPPPSAASTSRQPPPPPPPALPAIAAHPPTPELGRSPALRSAKIPSGASSGKSKAEKEEWRKNWPKERLRKLGAQCRELGRSLKHKGDAFARSSSSSSAARKDRLRAVAYQMDAILLYVFAFWCDDVAGKACLTQNWQSVFGLIGFVRKAAERESGAEAVVALCMRMEAIAVYTLSMHEQKALNYKGTQLQHSSSSSGSSSSSSSRAPPPPPPPPPPAETTASPSSISTGSPSAASPSSQPTAPGPVSGSSSSGLHVSAYTDFLRSFLRASPELFRCQRLYDDSCTALSPSILSTAFPRTWASCVSPVNFDHPDVGEFVVPSRPWRFAWPAELGRGTMGHQTAFARAVLEEWGAKEELGFEAAKIEESV